MTTTLFVGSAIVCILLIVLWPLRPRTLHHRSRTGVRQTTESTLAREKAERDLERVRAQTPRYRALADDLRAKREHNHFADSIARSMKTRESHP